MQILEADDRASLLTATLQVLARRTVAVFALQPTVHVVSKRFGVVLVTLHAEFVFIDALRTLNRGVRSLHDVRISLPRKQLRFVTVRTQILLILCRGMAVGTMCA
jgi:predicted YcjX-like family ATPase